MVGDQILDLQHVTISHGVLPMLKNISFSILEGELVYLIGRTGTGKSSLIRAICADVPIDDGVCKVVGFEVKGIKDRKIPFLRRKIGIIFQDFKLLYDRSVGENLAFVLRATGWKQKKKIKNRIEEVLCMVSMEDKIFQMPQQLSGGEQQRIAIARALLNDPDLILADEPTGNLDPTTSKEIMEVLTGLNKEKGITVFMSTHNHFLITQYPGRVLKCANSTIVEMDVIKKN